MKGLRDIAWKGLAVFVAVALGVTATEQASAQAESALSNNNQQHLERLFDGLERVGKGANAGRADQAALAEACAALNDYARGNEKTAGLVSFANRLGPLAAGVNVRSLCLSLTTSDNAITFESDDLIDAGIGLAAQTGADLARSTGLPYLNRLELEGSISSRDEASFSLTTVQPWLEDRVNHHYVFNQVSWYRQSASATDDGDPDDTLNIGWGYRRLVNDESLMLGVNAFFDHQLDQNHNRVSIGAEAQTQLYGIGANYYIPLTEWKVVDDLYEARALRGFDVELQGRHPNHPGLTGYLRGYSWDRYEGLSDIYGYAASVEYFPVKAVGFKLGFSDDNERESAITAGLRLRMNLGERLDLQMAEPVTLGAMSDRVFERVRRENIIRTQKRLRAPAVIYDVAVSESIGANVAMVAGVSQALAAGQQYELPLEIRTADAPGAIARLDLFGGGMLALGRDSHVLISDGEIDLQHGIAQYASGTESVLITTTGGTITLIGTDIDVVSDGTTASVRVRDGSISVAPTSGGGSGAMASVGDMLAIATNGATTSIAPTDPAYRAHTDRVSIDLDRVGSARTGDKVAPYPNALPQLVQGGALTGDEILIAQKFSQAVTVTGPTPWMEIMVGTTPRRALLASGSGTDRLVFSYILLAGDVGAVDVTAAEINANGATFAGAGKAVVTTFAAHEMDIDATGGGGSVTGRPFITTWNTAHAGVTGNNQIRLPLISSGTYDFTVDWGDGTPPQHITQHNAPERTHTYTTPGTYTVTITGKIEGWAFSDAGDEEKLENISQWGTLELTTAQAFWGATNLTITATDMPDIQSVSSFQGMFRDCHFLTTIPNMEKWDVARITNMRNMFRDARRFNQPIGDWDTSSVTDMFAMFAWASLFNQPIGDWDVSSVTTMQSLFYGAERFNQPIGGWDVSQVRNMSHMFRDAINFNQPINDWDVSSVTTMSRMFNGASLFDQNLGTWDVSNVNTMVTMLNGSGLSTENYDAALIGWADLPTLQMDVRLGGGGRHYSPAAVDARDTLINAWAWVISDAGPE